MHSAWKHNVNSCLNGFPQTQDTHLAFIIRPNYAAVLTFDAPKWNQIDGDTDSVNQPVDHWLFGTEGARTKQCLSQRTKVIPVGHRKGQIHVGRCTHDRYAVHVVEEQVTGLRPNQEYLLPARRPSQVLDDCRDPAKILLSRQVDQ